MNENPTANEIPPPAPRRRWDDVVYDWWAPKWRAIRGPFWVLFFLTLFLIAWLFDRIFVNIYPGNTGVMWHRFGGGTDMTRVYEGGLWVLNPFNRMYVYETRMQQRETNFTALTSNGLIIEIHASVRFAPEKKLLPLLHEGYGPDYVDRVVIPQVQSVIRKIIGAYEPDQIYGTQGNILQNVRLTAVGELRSRYIIVDDLLIKEILLPEKVANAIAGKLEQEQYSLQFKYILEREKQEADRKRIEAQGIQDFQRIVSKYLDDNYLRFRGIAASLELAKSPNAKVVVFGNSPNGLPLIMNMGNSPAAPTEPLPTAATVDTTGTSPKNSLAPTSIHPMPEETKLVPAAVADPLAAKP